MFEYKILIIPFPWVFNTPILDYNLSIMSTQIARKNPITEGPVFSSFVTFSLPLMLTSLMMQSYTIVDGLILGNYVNEEALGAVSSISSITDLMGLVQIGLSGGCSICISHLAGAGEYRRMSAVIRQMRWLVLIVSVLALGVGVLGADQILALTHTPPEIYAGAKTYLQIVCIGIPFSALYQLQSGVMRGMGDSKRPLGAITISTITNIAMDFFFVGALSMEILGAALATVLSQIFSCIYLFIKMQKKLQSTKNQMEFASSNGIPSPGQPWGEPLLSQIFGRFSDVKEIIQLGIPQMLQSSFTSIGKILLQSLTNSFGAFAVIGIAASYKIDSILIIPMIGISMSISVFIGQNMGAAKPQRARQSFRIAIRISLAISAVMTVVLLLFNKPLLGLFGLSNASLRMGHYYILICLPGYFLFGLQFVFNGFLQGTKNTRISSSISILALACRIVFAYAFANVLGVYVLPAAELLSWIVGGTLSGMACLHKLRTPLMRDIPNSEANH